MQLITKLSNIKERVSRAYFDLSGGRSIRTAPPAAALRNPVAPNLKDAQPWMFYDRVTTAANTATGTEYLFFAVPLGTNNKTKLDTNVRQAGRLPDPKHFIATALRFVPAPNMLLSDIQSLITNFYVEFQIGDKLYAEGHIDLYPGGAGLAGNVELDNQAAATRVDNWSNGVPDPHCINNWGTARSISILQGQNFGVALRGTSFTTAATGTGVNLRCVMDGILHREVQ